MLFKEFQDGCHGGHLGYLNGTIQANLNLYSAKMSPNKCRLHVMVWEEMFEEFLDGCSGGHL